MQKIVVLYLLITENMLFIQYKIVCMRRSSLQQLAHCQHLPTSTRQGNVGCATTCAVNQNVIEVTILKIPSHKHCSATYGKQNQ